MTTTPRLVRLVICLAAGLLLNVCYGRPAAAQFSAREGFAPDGSSHWSFELSPYVFLPNVSANIGLARPPGVDVTVNQNRPTVSKLLATLTGAFLGDALVRYGDWSAELNIFYVAAQVSKQFPPVLAGGPGATLKSTVSGVLVSPGFGYQVLPTDASSQFALDVRAGFTYSSVTAGAEFEQSALGGVDHNSSFVQPWIGTRVSYYPSPNWRIGGDVALTGLGVDGGSVGWNGRLGVSYLITNWFDVTLGYAATQTRRNQPAGSRGESRSVNLLAYGPVLAIGFRF